MIYCETQWAILVLNGACVKKWIHKPRKFWVECYPKISDFRTLLVVFRDFNDTKSTKTRAGALAGVGLALDPEGKKSVLIQPSSFELKKILKTLITVD